MKKLNIITESVKVSYKNEADGDEFGGPEDAQLEVTQTNEIAPMGAIGVLFLSGKPNFRAKQFEIEVKYITVAGPLAKNYVRVGFTDLEQILDFEEETKAELDSYGGLPTLEQITGFINKFGFVEKAKVRNVDAEYTERAVRPRLGNFDDGIEESVKKSDKKKSKKALEAAEKSNKKVFTVNVSFVTRVKGEYKFLAENEEQIDRKSVV